MKRLLLSLVLAATWLRAQPDVVALGRWKMRFGDDPRWAAPDFDDS